MNITNKITSSTYDIYAKLLTLMQHHIGDFEGNVDFLKSGQAAAILEMMSSVMKDSIFHKELIYNEVFLNTARMPKSIYNWAKMFGVDATKATPSLAKINITIKISELDAMLLKRKGNSASNAKYGSDVTSLEGKDVFVIDRGNSFISNNFHFTLERSIMIYKATAGTNNTNSAYMIKYINTEPETTKFGNRKTIYIGSTVSMLDGEQYITFPVEAFQYKVTSTQRQVTSSSFIDARTHDFTFTDQLAGMRLRYRKNNAFDNIDLIYSDADVKSTLYGMYNLIDSNTVRITFKSGNFTPSVGGTLFMDTYTTTGATGNRVFTSVITFQLAEDDYKSLGINASFSNEQAYGGIDVSSLEDIKSTIITEISTRDVIVTENDLNSYFKDLKRLFETIRNGQIEFVKKRSDLIQRLFNVYILVRDGLDYHNEVSDKSDYLSKIIPTNTVDINFPISSNMSKQFGSVIEQNIDPVTGKISYDYIPTNLVTGNDNYIVPFYMRINISPFKKVKYIYNVTNDSSALSTNTLNIVSDDSADSIVPSLVTINRGFTSIGTVGNSYDVKFHIISNKELKTTEGISLVVYQSDNSPTVLDTNFDIVETTELNNGLYNNVLQTSIEVSAEEFEFSNSSDFGTFIHLNVGSISIALSEESYFGLKMTSYSFDKATVSMECKSDNKLTLFQNLDTIMSSNIKINTAEDEDGVETITSITVEEVPVIHSSYISRDVNNIEAFINQIITYINILKDNVGRLETNTTFNLKFMNTFGPSMKYNVTGTNLDLELTVWLYEQNTAIETEIRDYIRVLVDKSNVENSLKVSKVIASVTAAYSKYIDHIDFEGLNGTFNQYIQAVETSSIQPEYFNLNTENLEKCIKFKVLNISN